MARDEAAFMKSQNFEFLRVRRSVLADWAGAAEAYAYSDPAASLMKQRQFVEIVVGDIYQAYQLRPPYSDNLNDLMNAEPFRQSVPDVVQNKLHAVRKAGNQAVHQHRPIPSQLAVDCLGQLFEIAQWFHLQVHRGSRADFGKYVPPSPRPPSDPKAQAKAQEALEKLRQMEAQFAAMLANLEVETKKRLEAERAAEHSEAELAQLKAEGQKVASVLHFNEATTRRRLIDQMLVEAGWEVGLHGVSTSSVGQEVELSTMKTESGKGYADYVLYGDDGKPLAVVEAKKTAKDAKIGAEQARLYATCLEKETGVRPVVFFTNGVDVFLWDDAQGYPYRKVYGFYSKDSLEYLVHQRTNKKPPTAIAPNLQIAGRMYQLEAVKRVCERFSDKFRKALVVQATGTGKTRVAISLCDVLMRAGWAKRILFLCDRRELRKQADRAFKEFLPGEPRVVVDSSTSSLRDKRIYLATYPAMMQCYEDFDVGFFDLVIADESHRSIYKKFRALFQHFDALEVGLTATPVQFIERNTYELFACEDRDPTSNFGFKEAISSNPPYLVPFRVRAFKSEFREKGVRYLQMNVKQRAEVEDQVGDPDTVDFDASQIDKLIFNKATSRFIWRSLMEEGLRDATGSRLGKTIVFARNHKHAVHLAELFSEMYPQYGSTFCRVIDNQEPKAEQLIDDFKDETNDLTIAISVDMLDTGIDVPEIVNLVFAKPVKSYVKFWQMIGRGTRLRPDLFGPGRPKTEFLIFDHWSNFWFFEEKYKEKEPSKQKSLLQHLFELRMEVAAAALEAMDEPVFQETVDLLVGDVRAARDAGSIEVRDKWKELETLSNRDRVAAFEAATVADLLSIAAPLMQWRNIRGEEDAYRFDRLVTALEVELLKGGTSAPRFLDYKERVLEAIELLMKNQSPVKAKAATITAVRGKAFWSDVTVTKLEEVRRDLRGIMKYQQQATKVRLNPLEIDVGDTDFVGRDHVPKLEGLELVEYQRRVESVLREHFASNATLLRIREGKIVKDEDLEQLAKLVLAVDDRANVKHLAGHDPEAKRSLLDVFRGLVGLDAKAVDEAFTAFVHKYPKLGSKQLRFLQLLKNHIVQNGGIERDALFRAPFTQLHADSVDGIFADGAQANEIFAILEAFEPKKAIPSDLPPASRAL